MKAVWRKRHLGGLAISLLIAACGTDTSSPNEPGEATTTSVPPVTTTFPTTTTVSPTTLPTSEETTTTLGSVLDEAEGSGCSPGPGDLADGDWYGYVSQGSANGLEFDLACWFTGEAAVRAAAEDGEESPPPNDFYVRNVSESTRSMEIVGDVPVTWYPDFGDPNSETTATYADWLVGIEDRRFDPGVWIEVVDVRVASIREQWVP